MILHTVNRSPFRSTSLASCLKLASDDDLLLLIEDGVYGGINANSDQLASRSLKFYALEADVVARGLSSRISENVQLIDYEKFVALCTEADAVKTWSS